jgi:hypothetical protein
MPNVCHTVLRQFPPKKPKRGLATFYHHRFTTYGTFQLPGVLRSIILPFSGRKTFDPQNIFSARMR